MLALVARGFTNREIAAALVISVKTASVHVSHILRKLDAPNRREAAAIAHRLAPPGDQARPRQGSTFVGWSLVPAADPPADDYTAAGETRKD